MEKQTIRFTAVLRTILTDFLKKAFSKGKLLDFTFPGAEMCLFTAVLRTVQSWQQPFLPSRTYFICIEIEAAFHSLTISQVPTRHCICMSVVWPQTIKPQVDSGVKKCFSGEFVEEEQPVGCQWMEYVKLMTSMLAGENCCSSVWAPIFGGGTVQADGHIAVWAGCDHCVGLH